MKTFLERISEDIIEKHGTDLSRIAVVFPNKRASLFMNDAIARTALEKTGKPVWSPAYITISELFRKQTEAETADEITLVCKLHKVYCKVTEENESLDKFYGWGRIMLSDFDDLDKNMGDAEQIFKNVSDLAKFETNDFLTDEQVKIIKQFYNNFSTKSEAKERFRKIWDKLGEIYTEYKKELGTATYEGALYRSVAESKEKLNLEYEKYIFVGFNMLQKAEQKLFDKIKDEGKAEFYWDFDKQYLLDPNSEAGHYIREYLDKYPNQINNDDETYDNFKKEKKLRYMSSSTNDLQGRYVGEWLQDNGGERIKAGRRTAIVLCDENLLQTVLHSVPEDAGALNVTMGIPVKQTPAASLVMQLISLQARTAKASNGDNKIYIKLLEGLLSHPYAKYTGINTTYNKLINDKKYMVELTEIGLEAIGGHSIKDINNWVSAIIENTAKNYDRLNNTTEEEKMSSDNQLAIESLYKAHTMLNRIGMLIEDGTLDVEMPTYASLVRQLIESASVPFHGEPAQGIQIMGLLETRNLDFDNVLMLSTNEGNMPKGVNDTSFIPYSIRKAFGLTTIDNKVAIYAYYFYSLLQRASDITITYSTVSEAGQKGEMSRFMQQIAVEKPESTTLSSYSMQSTIESAEIEEIKEIAKSPEVMKKLEKFESVSPSALNKYISCPLSYYYKYIAGLKDNEEAELGEVDAIKYGLIFHASMDQLYKDIENQILTADILKTKKKEVDKIVEQKFREELYGKDEIASNGVQTLTLNTIKTYVKKMIDIDIHTAENSDEFRILESEKPHYKEISAGGTTKKIGGIIDRIDSIKKDGEETIRIVDYKSGSAKSGVECIEDMFLNENKKKNRGYYLQTFLYSVIIKDKNPGKNVVPALLYIISAKKEDNPVLTMGAMKKKTTISDIGDYEEEFNELLKATLEELFDKNVPFRATNDDHVCKYCTFKPLCNHKTKQEEDDED
ncbi:MAG: PD-(D/E)XK nuclease family protein [Paludibacteraceae bacterium]|nr:PD-(D/E)XK nuclease family protein [Paludibacteraceae bacterium]